MPLTLIEAPSPNFNERLHPLDMLVLHYTGMADGPSALKKMRDPESQVSAHYMVEEDGTVFQLVAEDKRAWQAGRSWWQGDEDINSRSIGVEIVNGGHDYGLPPFPDLQIAAVIELCLGILERWPIPPDRIVAHSDIAPDRKDDPGERFPWKRLAEAGVGLWPEPRAKAGEVQFGFRPDESGERVEELQTQLAAIGYRQPATGQLNEWTRAVLRAFQRRYRPEAVTGEPDLATLSLVGEVAAMVRSERG
jgi:N-acetylmuramoyl-L-alanine amidase